MVKSGIEDDLQKTLATIARMTAAGTPGNDVLTEVSRCLTAFVARHRTVFSFENFPLPSGKEDVLTSYALNESGEYGPSLLVNVIRGGVDSVVHNHGTWAVIVGIAGAEHHRIYRRLDDAPGDHVATLELVREITISDGQSLILEENLFHSIHTDTNQTALQLHLYGRLIDTIHGRQIVDPRTGQIICLGGQG
ncbi:MAG: hypothetical protein KA735_05650 [Burkholderiaceae bacterium]|nr:hypothetical protein [Burkholderiaceae bacterium]